MITRKPGTPKAPRLSCFPKATAKSHSTLAPRCEMEEAPHFARGAPSLSDKMPRGVLVRLTDHRTPQAASPAGSGWCGKPGQVACTTAGTPFLFRLACQVLVDNLCRDVCAAIAVVRRGKAGLQSLAILTQ
jgi:hypothetical protein